MSFSPGGILLVPVLFSDGSGHKKRPVVIIYDSGDADSMTARRRLMPYQFKLVAAFA
jgi:hypothetical protein